MSKHLGGMFSRGSGKLSGLIAGSANTRRGKKMTLREFVIPSNPRTPAQVLQRLKFSSVSEIMLKINPSIYQIDFNKKVNGLAGYNQLSSVLLRNMSGADTELSIPSPVGLGTLHFPDDFSASLTEATGNLDIEFSSELGFNGDAADQANIIVIQNAAIPSDPSARLTVSVFRGAVRDDGIADVQLGEGFVNPLLVGLYFSGGGDNPSSFLSRCHWVASSAP